MKYTLSRARQSYLDDLHGFEVFERGQTGRLLQGGLSETAHLTRGKYGVIYGAMVRGHPVQLQNGDTVFRGKGLADILQPVAKTNEELDDTLRYFIGRSANELMQQGRENLLTKPEIKAYLKLYTPERAKAFEEYQSFNNKVLDFAQAKGAINPQSRAAWRPPTVHAFPPGRKEERRL